MNRRDFGERIFCFPSADNFIRAHTLSSQKTKRYKLGHLGAWGTASTDVMSADPAAFSSAVNHLCVIHISAYPPVWINSRYQVETSRFCPRARDKKRSVNMFVTGTTAALWYPCSQWRTPPLWVTQLCRENKTFSGNPFKILNIQLLFKAISPYDLAELCVLWHNHIMFICHRPKLPTCPPLVRFNPVYSQRCIPLSWFDICSKWIGCSYF